MQWCEPDLWREVPELALHSLCNGSQQVIPRVVPHDSVCVHHVGQGLRAQLQIGLIFGDPVGQAVYGFLCKGLQQGPDLGWIVADLGQRPDDDT